MYILIIFLSIMTFLEGVPCWAQVDLRTTQPLQIPHDTVTPTITSADVAKIVPLDVKSSDSTQNVLTRIVDRTVNMWLNSEVIKNSRFGRAVDKSKDALKTDIEMSPAEPEGISHKFTFRIEAFEAAAKVEYKGWVKAKVDYHFNGDSKFEVRDKVFDNKDLVISHISDKEQALSMIGLAWAF